MTAEQKERIEKLMETRREFMKTKLGSVLAGAVIAGVAGKAFAVECHVNKPAHTDILHMDAKMQGQPHQKYILHTDNTSHVDEKTTHQNHTDHEDKLDRDKHTNHLHVNSPHLNHYNSHDCGGHRDTPHQDNPHDNDYDKHHVNESPHTDHCNLG